MFLLTNKFSFLWFRTPKATNSRKLGSMEALFRRQCSNRPGGRNGHESFHASAQIVRDRLGERLRFARQWSKLRRRDTAFGSRFVG
jgi:hypothetical protein